MLNIKLDMGPPRHQLGVNNTIRKLWGNGPGTHNMFPSFQPIMGGGGIVLNCPPPECNVKIGDKVGNWKITNFLGEGGNGYVLFGENPNKKLKKCAIKLLKLRLLPDEKETERFKREIKIGYELKHSSNVVKIFDFDFLPVRDGAGNLIGYQPYFVTEYMDPKIWPTLADEMGGFDKSIGQNKPVRQFSLDEAVDISLNIARELEQIHKKDIHHRDIKPDNIFIGHGNKIKIGDFGISHSKNIEDVTVTPPGPGTHGYAPPEQASTPKDTDFKVDIYALGIVFYELLHGLKHWGDFTTPLLQILINKPGMEIDAVLPGPVKEIITTATKIDPDKRYPNISTMISALEAVNIRGTIASPATKSSSKQPYGLLLLKKYPLKHLPYYGFKNLWSDQHYKIHSQPDFSRVWVGLTAYDQDFKPINSLNKKIVEVLEPGNVFGELGKHYFQVNYETLNLFDFAIDTKRNLLWAAFSWSEPGDKFEKNKTRVILPFDIASGDFGGTTIGPIQNYFGLDVNFQTGNPILFEPINSGTYASHIDRYNIKVYDDQGQLLKENKTDFGNFPHFKVDEINNIRCINPDQIIILGKEEQSRGFVAVANEEGTVNKLINEGSINDPTIYFSGIGLQRCAADNYGNLFVGVDTGSCEPNTVFVIDHQGKVVNHQVFNHISSLGVFNDNLLVVSALGQPYKDKSNYKAAYPLFVNQILYR